MAQNIELVAGSVIGRDHVRTGKPNQDAFYTANDLGENLTVAIVADGCGESKHSEVGAQLGARLIGSIILEDTASLFNRIAPDNHPALLVSAAFWERVRSDAVSELRVLSRELGPSISDTVSEFFLFTIVGALIAPQTSVFFSFGDGVLFVNGIQFPLGPFAGNAPPYIGYDLVGTTDKIDESSRRFRVVTSCPTEELHSFLLGSDGIQDLIDAKGRKVPGKEEVVEDIATLWSDERFFLNRVLLHRRLRILNTDSHRPNWEERRIVLESGLLPDDTTMIVGRRSGNTDA